MFYLEKATLEFLCLLSCYLSMLHMKIKVKQIPHITFQTCEGGNCLQSVSEGLEYRRTVVM